MIYIVRDTSSNMPIDIFETMREAQRFIEDEQDDALDIVPEPNMSMRDFNWDAPIE